jgi:hypothetical protein
VAVSTGAPLIAEPPMSMPSTLMGRRKTARGHPFQCPFGRPAHRYGPAAGPRFPGRPLTRAPGRAPLSAMKVTYYLEVLSSWCHWVEPVWAELKPGTGRAEFEWRIALMRQEDFPVSRSQCDWFYRRSGGTVMRSPVMLNSGWFEEGRTDATSRTRTWWPRPPRTSGSPDDRVRLASARAALDRRPQGGRHGRRRRRGLEGLGDTGEEAQGPRGVGRRQGARPASTAEFHAHRITQRPAFVLEDAIGDKAVFSGLVRIEPLAAAIDAMLSDTAAYAAHAAHHGAPPKA